MTTGVNVGDLDWDLVQRASQIRRRCFPPVVDFVHPTRTIPVSLTGRTCALDCGHCGGHYLAGMVPVNDALKVFRTRHAVSFLVSGGCDANGKVPVRAAAAAVAGMRAAGRVNLHPGLAGPEDIPGLKDLADVVSFDFLADTETIRDVTGLDRTGRDYAEAYTALRSRFRVVPHICIGVRGGALSGEERAVEALKDLGVDALVFLVFRPTPGTRFGRSAPPDITRVIEFMARTRVALPNTPLYLGCMRPGGRYRNVLDSLALAVGVNKIVQPAPGLRDEARAQGLNVTESRECCAF